MPPRRVLLAWELGGNRGYLRPLAGLLSAWRRQGVEVLVAAKDPATAQDDLAPLGVGFVRAPTPVQSGWGDSLNYAGLLAQAGWNQPGLLAGLIQSWRTLFQLHRPDVLVAHHAPTALLAARGDGLPAWRLGSGFVCPPREVPFPSLRPWMPLPAGRLAALEDALLEPVNRGLALAGRPGLNALVQAFEESRDILLTVPELDHYLDARRPGHDRGHDGSRPDPADYWGLPPDRPPPCSPGRFDDTTGPGAERPILGYVRRGYPHFAEALAALAGAGRPARLYCPDAGDDDLAPGRWGRRVALTRQPLDLAAGLPGAAAFVCHGGHAASLEALMAGVPLMLLPTQVEQFLLGRRVEALGAGRQINPEIPDRPYARALAEVLENPACRSAARDFARRHEVGRTPARWEEMARHCLG